MAPSTSRLAGVAAALALSAGGAAAQQAPDPHYRAGTVPTVGADATNTNVGVSPSPVNPSGTTSNTGTPVIEPAASAASGTVGGFGPLTTDNGVAAGRAASTPTTAPRNSPATAPASAPLSPETSRAIQRARQVREPQRAASSAAGTASKR
jgi:hypothetical protein